MNILDPASHESSYVHDVYEHIAPHFSQTRYKPWPLISSFLSSLPVGSVGVDLGCGNGKYLSVNPNIYIVASDRSQKLVGLASSSPSSANTSTTTRTLKNDVAVADLLDNPHPNARFDFAISIAVVHHFASRERRVLAVKTILDTLNGSGRGLVYVWALEQKSSRRGWDEGDSQDVFVPWVMAKQQQKKDAAPAGGDNNNNNDDDDDQPPPTTKNEERTVQRYYHLYKKGELEEDVAAAGGEVINSGYEKDNWWVIMRRK